MVKANIPLYYWRPNSNFGDQLSPYIIEKVTGGAVSYATPFDNNKIVAIGSLLTYDVIHTQSIIWGSGTLTRKALKFRLPKLFPLPRSISQITRFVVNRNKLAKFYAVRGPLTRQCLSIEGIYCPTVYGDPAIIMPRFYKPKNKNSHKIGLVLHMTQESLVNSEELKNNGIQCISIHREGNNQLEDFVDEICSCERVFSTSLHGLIIAQAYGVPAQWVRVNNLPIHADEAHKFNDYFLGTGQTPQTPVHTNIQTKDLLKLQNQKVAMYRVPETLGDTLLSAFPDSLY